MSSNSSPSTLPQAVSDKLPKEKEPKRFGRLVFKTTEIAEKPDGTKTSQTAVTTYTDVGQGLVQRLKESSSNDIPFLLTYSLGYKGVFDLRWQRVPLLRSIAGFSTEVKSISRLDPIPSAAGTTFRFEYTTGRSVQIANYGNFIADCTTGRSFQASSVHPRLPGEATEIDCQISKENVVLSKVKWFYFRDYGLAFPISASESTDKLTSTIVDVTN